MKYNSTIKVDINDSSKSGSLKKKKVQGYWLVCGALSLSLILFGLICKWWIITHNSNNGIAQGSILNYLNINNDATNHDGDDDDTKDNLFGNNNIDINMDMMFMDNNFVDPAGPPAQQVKKPIFSKKEEAEDLLFMEDIMMAMDNNNNNNNNNKKKNTKKEFIDPAVASPVLGKNDIDIDIDMDMDMDMMFNMDSDYIDPAGPPESQGAPGVPQAEKAIIDDIIMFNSINGN